MNTVAPETATHIEFEGLQIPVGDRLEIDNGEIAAQHLGQLVAVQQLTHQGHPVQYDSRHPEAPKEMPFMIGRIWPHCTGGHFSVAPLSYDTGARLEPTRLFRFGATALVLPVLELPRP